MASSRSGTGHLLLALALAPLAPLLITACDRQAPRQPQGAPTAPAAKSGAVDRSHAGEAGPIASFQDPAGKPVTLAAFAGQPFLLNLWATWCGPCVAELPTLDRAARAGTRVVAVSQDMDAAKAAPFFRARGVTLTPYRDPELALSLAYGGNLPTSIFFGADGRERWRVTGGRDWTGVAAKALLAER